LSHLINFKGKTFKSLEEATAYEKKWRDEPADLDDFKRFLSQRCHEASMNADCNPNFTNRLLYKLLRMHTDWVEDDGK
jgi:hypothetical protein